MIDREVQEVRNAIKAYERIAQWNPASGESTPFIVFMPEAILEAVRDFGTKPEVSAYGAWVVGSRVNLRSANTSVNAPSVTCYSPLSGFFGHECCPISE